MKNRAIFSSYDVCTLTVPETLTNAVATLAVVRYFEDEIDTAREVQANLPRSLSKIVPASANSFQLGDVLAKAVDYALQKPGTDFKIDGLLTTLTRRTTEYEEQATEAGRRGCKSVDPLYRVVGEKGLVIPLVADAACESCNESVRQFEQELAENGNQSRHSRERIAEQARNTENRRAGLTSATDVGSKSILPSWKRVAQISAVLFAVVFFAVWIFLPHNADSAQSISMSLRYALIVGAGVFAIRPLSTFCSEFFKQAPEPITAKSRRNPYEPMRADLMEFTNLLAQAATIRLKMRVARELHDNLTGAKAELKSTSLCGNMELLMTSLRDDIEKLPRTPFVSEAPGSTMIYGRPAADAIYTSRMSGSKKQALRVALNSLGNRLAVDGIDLDVTKIEFISKAREVIGEASFAEIITALRSVPACNQALEGELIALREIALSQMRITAPILLDRFKSPTKLQVGMPMDLDLHAPWICKVLDNCPSYPSFHSMSLEIVVDTYGVPMTQRMAMQSAMEAYESFAERAQECMWGWPLIETQATAPPKSGLEIQPAGVFSSTVQMFQNRKAGQAPLPISTQFAAEKSRVVEEAL